MSNDSLLSTYSIFFDEIHFITDTVRLEDQDPTLFFKNLSNKFHIALSKEADTEEKDRVIDFAQFIVNNQELIGDILFFHNDLIGGSISEYSHKLLTGKLPISDFLNFLSGNTREMKIYEDYRKQNPDITDDRLLRISSTAINLSNKNNWILIGDKSDLQIPLVTIKHNEVKYLTTILAEECMRVVLPKCLELNPEDIIKVRELLKEELVPFRMTLQKMSAVLRSGVKENASLEEIRSEAKFIVESQVEPALHDLKRKIKLDSNKFWIKVFGKTISWIPLVAKTYLLPGLNSTLSALEKIYGDVGYLTSDINELNLSKEPALSFLLKADEFMNNQ